MTEDNPSDAKNIRSLKFRCRARLEPSRDDPAKSTLILAVPDGPETSGDFDPAGDVDRGGECSLTEAITAAVNRLLKAAQEGEARHWINDHQECFLVIGRTGDGLDAQQWTVGAFASETRAWQSCRGLNDWCEGQGLDFAGARVATIVDPTGTVARHPLDEGFRVDGGTEYEVMKVPLDMFNPYYD